MDQDCAVGESNLDARKGLIGFASLLGSSVVSALGFVIIASNRWGAFDPATGAFIILFVQWQTLGLTISKMGIEQVVFAMASENPQAFLDPGHYVLKRIVPVAALFSLAVLAAFSPLAAAVAFATIVLDSWSLIVMADLNARERFTTVAVSNLLNYPLFFAALFALGFFLKVTPEVTLGAFFASSLARRVWLGRSRVIEPGMAEADCTANIEMGLQQGLNYVLFRADQIVLALIGLKLQAQEMGMYLFLAKYPELAAGVAGIAGAVLFPKIYLKHPFNYRAVSAPARKYPLLVPAYVAAIVVSILAYVRFWNGPEIPAILVLPFFVHALCILGVNNVTYSFLRQGYLPRLLRNLVFSVGVGLVALLPLLSGFSAGKLAWIVPAQLMTFIAASLFFRWGERRELYG